MRELSLALRSVASRRIGVHVGVGAAERLTDHVAARFAGRLAVVLSDSNVGPLHGAPVRDALISAGLAASMLVFPAGEKSKSREMKAELEDRLAALGAGRDTVIVAVGGGVTGDLAGFVAATWQRGIPVVHVPTSLLAMVDSALGGKTAVDIPAGKNLIGAFHQPDAIFVEVAHLATLPHIEVVRGSSEVVKTAVVADRALFSWLESDGGRLLRRDPEAVVYVVDRCLRAKARIVAKDEREAGRRAVLNFGHTVAHALEAASGYGVSHGEAVAVGMTVEARLAVELGGFPERHFRRLRGLLEQLGLPTRWPREISAQHALDAARSDKKTREGRLRCALPLQIGTMPRAADPTREISDASFLAAVQAAGL